MKNNWIWQYIKYVVEGGWIYLCTRVTEGGVGYFSHMWRGIVICFWVANQIFPTLGSWSPSSIKWSLSYTLSWGLTEQAGPCCQMSTPVVMDRMMKMECEMWSKLPRVLYDQLGQVKTTSKAANRTYWPLNGAMLQCCQSNLSLIRHISYCEIQISFRPHVIHANCLFFQMFIIILSWTVTTKCKRLYKKWKVLKLMRKGDTFHLL